MASIESPKPAPTSKPSATGEFCTTGHATFPSVCNTCHLPDSGWPVPRFVKVSARETLMSPPSNNLPWTISFTASAEHLLGLGPKRGVFVRVGEDNLLC
jgi:hypothetical protein